MQNKKHQSAEKVQKSSVNNTYINVIITMPFVDSTKNPEFI
jgi:hypothetical protein